VLPTEKALNTQHEQDGPNGLRQSRGSVALREQTATT
jgi:hypothetical protein